jgi:hypothetical protein
MSYHRGLAASEAARRRSIGVCDDCNAYFGRELDQLLTRDTYEGISRYSRGQFSSQARLQKRVRLVLADPAEAGAFQGLRVADRPPAAETIPWLLPFRRSPCRPRATSLQQASAEPVERPPNNRTLAGRREAQFSRDPSTLTGSSIGMLTSWRPGSATGRPEGARTPRP